MEFDKYSFMKYLDSQFNGFENCFLRNLVDNIIDHGIAEHNQSKDQLANWLADMIPEVEFGEVAVFCSNDMLTTYGKSQAKLYKEIKNNE